MMLKIYSCIQNEHDLKLVILAGMICVTASIAVVILLRHARDASTADTRRWLAAAGITSGFGFWATHFVAMLGFNPGVIVGYALVPTVASLVIAVVSTTSGFALALRSTRLMWHRAAGAVVGLGIAAMHYTGMQAVEIAGDLRLSASYVLASLLFAVVPIIPALSLALNRQGTSPAIQSGLLIVLAILMLHFTGMAGISIIPGAVRNESAMLLSPLAMGVGVAGTAFVVLIVGMVLVFISGRARVAIAASEREFKVLVQGISDCAIYMLDANGRVASWNSGAQRLKGYTAIEAVGLELAAFYSPEERAAGLPDRGIKAALAHGRFNGEGWRYRKDGSRFWAHVTIEAVHDNHGVFHGYAKITRDMTRFKQDQDRLTELASNLDAALANMHQGLCLFDADERLVISNSRVGTIFGLTHEECPPGTSFRDVFKRALEKRSTNPVPADLLDEVICRHRTCIATPGGGTLIVPFTSDCTLSVTHQSMPAGGWVTTFDDITDRRKAEQRIEYMALHDALTGLPNRLQHTEQLEAEIQSAVRSGARVAVIGIDLDRFKEVNDAHGHAIGDQVLRLLAERMTAALQSGEQVARFGGDEFAAFKTFNSDTDLDQFISRLERALTTPIPLDGLSISSGASLGVAIFPSDGGSREQVVNNADLAMYRAKATIGLQHCYYEHGMDDVARARRVLATDLREAIARNELSIVYQVQKSVRTEHITGYEALLRWHHPRTGSISPTEFIPIAEESSEILRIGEWALRNACMEAARWSKPWRVAVNLSPIQLMQIDLITIVTSALVESGLPANRLELEITETAIVKDKVRALHVLRQIKALGVAIAIDDFGTGYSSLDTLNSFPFDKIKIDKSFLINADSSHQARAIIRAVLALGRSLEVPVLAEGLETEDQLRLLRAEGCDEAQGYLWGRPMHNPSYDQRKIE